MKIKFWVAIGKAKQGAFRDNGSTYEIDVKIPVGEQHIIYSEVLMCRQSRESIKGKLGAKKQRTVSNRIPGIPLCQKCEKKFKEHPDLDWRKWTDGQNGQVVRQESCKKHLNAGEDHQENQTGVLLHS